MSRRTVRERWYAAVIKTTLVNGACRELLSLMAVKHMTERGYVKVPRSTLADELGIVEHRVTVRTGEAVKAGLLIRVGGGVNGQTVQYAAQLPPTEGVAERHPGPEVEGVAEAAPGGVAERHPGMALGNSSGCRRTTPIRARATCKNREQELAPVDSREERDHRVNSTAGNYGSWQPLSSNCAVADSSRTEAEERGRALREAALGRKAS